MLVVAGYAEVDFAKLDDPYAALVAMMRETRKELGCYAYLLVPDPIQDNRISIFERWESEAHLKAHFATPHMAEFNRVCGPAITALHVKIYDVAGERDLAL